MLRQANDFIGPFLLLAFAVIMAGTPLAVLVLTVINLVRSNTRRGTIILQATVSVAIWLLLTFGIAMILMVIIFSFTYPLSQADELKSTGAFIAGTIIYALIGAALIYWTRRQHALSVMRSP